MPGIRLTLYGGEPLMRETAAIAEYIVSRAVDLGMRLDAITNTVELDQFAHLLGPERIATIQVTLDGPRDVHDKKRRGPRYRQGTYDIILRNVQVALDCNTNVNVRVHVSHESAHRAGEVMQDLEARGLLASPRFKVYASPVHDFSQGYTPDSYGNMLIHEAQEALDGCAPTAQTGKTLEITQHQVRDKLQTCMQKGLIGLGSQPLFCGSQAGVYIFDTFGSVFKCWEKVGKPELEIGRYYPDGLALNERDSEWRGRSPARIRECVDCKYLFLHVGGCALSAPPSERGLLAPGCFGYEDDFVKFGRKFFEDFDASLAVSATQMTEKGGDTQNETQRDRIAQC
jgi:uncharacterized protein